MNHIRVLNPAYHFKMAENLKHYYATKFNDVGPHHDSAEKALVSASSNTAEAVVTATSHSVASVTPGDTSFLHQVSPSVAIDRCIYLRCRVRCTITSASNAAGRNLHTLRGVSLAQFPLSRIMNSVTLKLNNVPISFTPSRYSRALWKLHDSAELRRLNSLSPSQPDSFNNMPAMAVSSGAPIADDTWLLDSTNPNPQTALYTAAGVLHKGDGHGEACAADSPFASHGNEGYSGSRASFVPSSVTYTPHADGVTAESIVLTYTVTEPLMLPILKTGSEAESTMARIQTIAADIKWNNLNGCFTVCQELLRDQLGNNVNFVCNGFVGNAELLLRTYNPYIKIPAIVKTHFNAVTTRSFNVTLTNTGQTATLNTGAIRFNMVPNRLVIFAQPRNATAVSTHADAFAAITSLTMKTDADSGNFASATAEQLFEMSSRNGYNGSYTQWRYKQGSVLVIDFSKGDVSSYIGGVRRDFSFELIVGLQNTQFTQLIGRSIVNTSQSVAAADSEYELNVVAFTDSMFISNGTSSSIEEGLNPDLALAAMSEDPDMAAPEMSAHHLQGSGIFGKLMRGLGKVGKHVISKVGNRVLDAGLSTVGLSGGGVRASGLRIMN